MAGQGFYDLARERAEALEIKKTLRRQFVIIKNLLIGDSFLSFRRFATILRKKDWPGLVSRPDTKSQSGAE
jgi:hypothetical protein